MEKKAKELSDTYFDIVNHQILESLINKVYLAPFPSEFANVSDLQAALDLLNSSRAENLKEVYEILERRHAEAARSNAEAQHRAKFAERVLRSLARLCAKGAKYYLQSDKAVKERELYDEWINNAEKELAEEKKE